MALSRGLFALKTGDAVGDRLDHPDKDSDLSGSFPVPATASGSLAVDVTGTPAVGRKQLGF